MAVRALWPLLVLLVVVACGPAKHLRARGLAPAPTTAQALDAALEPARVAIVIGVDHYEDPAFPDLVHARHDADAVAERLVAAGFDPVIRVDGERTTRDQLLAALRQTTAVLRAEDTLVLYHSGHGSRVPDGERWRRFLLTTDSRAGHLEATAIDLEALEDWFGDRAPVRKALILDACFSGDGKSVVRPGAPSESAENVIGRTTPADLDAGEIHLHATSPGRPALEDDRLGHGVYTHHLLEALGWEAKEADLDQDGVVTAWEAHLHARERTRTWTRGAQVPEVFLRAVGEADVVLSGDPDRRRTDRSLIYLLGEDGADRGGTRLLVDGRAKGGLPGTLPVAAGTHRLTLVDAATDEVILDGRTRLRPGRAYTTDDLTHRIVGPGHELAVGLGVGSHPLYDALDGRVATTLSLSGSTVRRTGTARGLGAFVLTEAGRLADKQGGRWVLGAGAGGLVQARHRRWVGWFGAGAIVDVAPAEDDRYAPDGWYLISLLGDVGTGVRATDVLTVFVAVRPRLGAFDEDGDGDSIVVGSVPVTVGVRLAR